MKSLLERKKYHGYTPYTFSSDCDPGFGGADPAFGGADRIFQQAVPGAKGQLHTRISGASHCLQEDKGPELAQIIVDFLAHSS